MNNKVIAVLGTASNVGKSSVVSALARYYANKGLKVAPFKALNISLNSGVSKESLEIARSQISQSLACYKQPSIFMNPILLKPNSTKKMELLVLGKKIDSNKLIECSNDYLNMIIDKSFKELANENDLIIIEGSGSCCELNLKEKDLANFPFVLRVNAPTILVADIENCGIFANVYGTLKLLSKKERDLIKGIIINKYHGDTQSFDKAKILLEKICKKPVLGVISMHDINIDEEDGICKNNCLDKSINYQFDIVVIKLPYLANTTDFQPLHELNNVKVRYEDKQECIGNCDLLIIPSSNNVLRDLEFLNNTKISLKIKELAKQNVTILGINTGYQLLGQKIIFNCKSDVIDGLKLLNHYTILDLDNKSFNIKANVVQSDFLDNIEHSISGFILSKGKVILNDLEQVWIKDKNNIFGSKKANVFGTLLHGIFENSEFMLCFLNNIDNTKEIQSNINLLDDKLTLLSDHFIKCCDMAKINQIIERGLK